MKLRLEAARLLLYRACWLKDKAKTPMAEIAMAKLAVSEGAVQSALDAVQLFGSTGYASDARSGPPSGMRLLPRSFLVYPGCSAT